MSVSELERKEVERKEAFVKLDTGKPSFEFVYSFDRELGGVNNCLQYGAAKYERDNWKLGSSRESIERNLSAACRHVFAHGRGETLDEESGLPHLHHAITDLLFCAYHLRGTYSDLPKGE